MKQTGNRPSPPPPVRFCCCFVTARCSTEQLTQINTCEVYRCVHFKDEQSLTAHYDRQSSLIHLSAFYQPSPALIRLARPTLHQTWLVWGVCGLRCWFADRDMSSYGTSNHFLQGRGGLGGYPRGEGGVHPGRAASLSMSQHGERNDHPHSHSLLWSMHLTFFEVREEAGLTGRMCNSHTWKQTQDLPAATVFP